MAALDITVAQAGATRRSGNRLLVLDGLRGVCALAVMLMHVWRAPDDSLRFPAHAYMAVDVFFLLSGYVLAGAYEDRLREGGVREVLIARFARLYPLYLFGLLLGFRQVLGVKGAGVAVPALLANILFLPAPIAPIPGSVGLDAPLWSLQLEALVNVCFALGLYRASNKWLGAISGLSGAVFLLLMLRFHDARFGSFELPGALDYLSGLARVWFSFPLGWLIWRCRARLSFRRPAWLTCMAWAAIAFAFSYGWRNSIAIDLPAVLVLLPCAIIVLIGASQPDGLPGRMAEWAGRLSYPLYVVHWPIAVFILDRTGLSGAPATALAVIASLVVALMAHLSIEPAGRRWISRLQRPSLGLAH